MIKKVLKYIVVVMIVVFIGNLLYLVLQRKPNVALVTIDGIITPSKVNRIIESINKAERNPHIRAILIKINSGGGEAVSSQRLYLAIKNASKYKFTVALIESIGASGAYYAACGAKKIVSYPASIVGSIGVIFETLNIAKLAKKIGIGLFVVKTGKLKDVGNPFRKPTKYDRRMIKNMIMSVYNQFLNAVSKSRDISLNKLKSIANGSVFSGKQALELHLIDSIGGLKEAKYLIKKNTHLKNIILKNFNSSKKGILYFLTESYNYINLLTQPSVKTMVQ